MSGLSGLSYLTIQSSPEFKKLIPSPTTALPWKSELPQIEFPMPINVGPIAHEYLNNYFTKKGDRTFGIKYKNGVYYLGNTRIDFDGNTLIIGGKEYEGTPGLWGLLTSVKPSLKDTTYILIFKIMVN